MGMPEQMGWTRERVLDLPTDGNRYELIDGKLLVTSAPRVVHQIGLMTLARLIDRYVVDNRLGVTMPLAADLELQPGQLVQPDLFVLPPGPRFDDWEDAPRPLLVVEILSPSTAYYDRTLKRHFYQRAGVPEYWIVDLDARLIERWRPDDTRPEVASEALAWQPASHVAALEIALIPYFAEVVGG